MPCLRNDHVALDIDPLRGGGVTCFTWRGHDVFRPALPGSKSPFDLSNFVLVPFSNRIADGGFTWRGQRWQVAPNFPGDGENHPMHGFGWQAAWTVTDHDQHQVTLLHQHESPEWPGSYCATQQLILFDDGYRHVLSIRNLGTAPIPAGLGLHPYFPRPGARIDAAFSGVWNPGRNGLPGGHSALPVMPDWFSGTQIDTVFSGRKGTIGVHWPTHSLSIEPDADLGLTVVYIPAGADFFCIEPVSHATDAINRSEEAGGMRALAPGEIWQCAVRFRLNSIV